MTDFVTVPRKLILDVLGNLDEDCSYDHDGDCQTHFVENPCSVALLRAAADDVSE